MMVDWTHIDTHEAVGLKASELVDDLLDLLCSVEGGGHLYDHHQT